MRKEGLLKLAFILVLISFVFKLTFAQTAVPGVIEDSTKNVNITYTFKDSKNIYLLDVNLSTLLITDYVDFTINDTAAVNESPYVGAFWGCTALYGPDPRDQYIVCLSFLGFGNCKLQNGKKLCVVNLTSANRVYPWIVAKVDNVLIRGTPKFQINYSLLNSTKPMLDTEHVWILPLLENNSAELQESNVTLELGVSPFRVLYLNATSLTPEFNLSEDSRINITELKYSKFYVLSYVSLFAKKYLVYPWPFKFEIVKPAHDNEAILLKKIENSNNYTTLYNATVRFFNPYYLSLNHTIMFNRTSHQKLGPSFSEFSPHNITVAIIINKSAANCTVKFLDRVYVYDNFSGKLLDNLTVSKDAKSDVEVYLNYTNLTFIEIYNFTIRYLPVYSLDNLIEFPFNLTCQKLDPPTFQVIVYSNMYRYIVNVTDILAQDLAFVSDTSNIPVTYLPGYLIYVPNVNRETLNRTAIIAAQTLTDQFVIDRNLTKNNSQLLGNQPNISIYLYKRAEIDPTSDYFRLEINLTNPYNSYDVRTYYYNSSSSEYIPISCNIIPVSDTRFIIDCNITNFNVTPFKDYIIVNLSLSSDYSAEGFCATVYALENATSYTPKDTFCLSPCDIHITKVFYESLVNSSSNLTILGNVTKLYFAVNDKIVLSFWTACRNVIVARNCTENGCYPINSNFEEFQCKEYSGRWFCNLTIKNVSTWMFNDTFNYYIFTSYNTTEWKKVFGNSNYYQINISNLPDFITKQGDYQRIDVYQLYPVNITLEAPRIAKLEQSFGGYSANITLNITYQLPDYCDKKCLKVPFNGIFIFPMVLNLTGFDVSLTYASVKVLQGLEQANITFVPSGGGVDPGNLTLTYANPLLNATKLKITLGISGSLDWPKLQYTHTAYLKLTKDLSFTYRYNKSLTEFYYNLTTDKTYLVLNWILPKTAYVGWWSTPSGSYLLVTIPFEVIRPGIVPRVVLNFSSGSISILGAKVLGIYPPAASISSSGSQVTIENWNITQPLQTPMLSVALVASPASGRNSIAVELPSNITISDDNISIPISAHVIASTQDNSNVTVFFYPNDSYAFYISPESYQVHLTAGSQLNTYLTLTLFRIQNSSFVAELVAPGYLIYNTSINLTINFSLYNSKGALKHTQLVPHFNGTASFNTSKVIYNQFYAQFNGTCIGYDLLNTEIIIKNAASAKNTSNVIFNITLVNGSYGFKVLDTWTENASCSIADQGSSFVTISCPWFGSNGTLVIKFFAIQNTSYKLTNFKIDTYLGGRYLSSQLLQVPNCGKPWFYLGMGCKYPLTDRPINETIYGQLHLINGYPWNHSAEILVSSLCFANSADFVFNATNLSSIKVITILTDRNEGCCSVTITPLNVSPDQIDVETSCTEVPSCPSNDFYIGDFVNVIYEGPSYYSSSTIDALFLLIPVTNENIYVNTATISLKNGVFSGENSNVKVVKLNKLLTPNDILTLGPYLIEIKPYGSVLQINVTLDETSASSGIHDTESYLFIVSPMIYRYNNTKEVCQVNLKFSDCTLYGCQLPATLNITATETCSSGSIEPYELGFYVTSYNGTVEVVPQSSLYCNAGRCHFQLRVNVSRLGTWGYIVFYVQPKDGKQLYTSCSCRDCRVLVDTRSRVDVNITDVQTEINGTVYHWCYCPQHFSTVLINVTNRQPQNYSGAVLNLSFLNNSRILSRYNKTLDVQGCTSQIVRFYVVPTTETFGLILANASLFYKSQLLGSDAKLLPLCPPCKICYQLESSEIKPSNISCSDWIDRGSYYEYPNASIRVTFLKLDDTSCPRLEPKISFNISPADLQQAYTLNCRLVSKNVQVVKGQWLNYTLTYNCTLKRVKKIAYPQPLPSSVDINVYFQFNPLLNKIYLGTITDNCFANQVHQVCLVNGNWLHDALDVGEVFDSNGNLQYKIYICWNQYTQDYIKYPCYVYIANEGWVDLSKYEGCTYSVPLAEYLYSKGKSSVRDYVVQNWLGNANLFPWSLSSASFASLSCSNLNDPSCLSRILGGSAFYRPAGGFCCGSCGGLGTCKLINDTCVCVPKIANPCLRAAVLVCAYRVLTGGATNCQEACQFVINPGEATQYCQQIVSQANGNPSIVAMLLHYDAFRTDLYTLRPVADSECLIGEICKLYASPSQIDIGFRAGFLAGECIPAALEFGHRCVVPDFEYYINYSEFPARCSSWFGQVGLGSLVTSVPEICEYRRTGCKVSAGGVYSIAYNFTSRDLGWSASCGDYPCFSIIGNTTMMQQIYLLYYNGSKWLWCRFGGPGVAEAGDCDYIFNLVRQLGGIDQALKNPNFKFIKLKVPAYMANKTLISFVGNSIYLLGQVKIPASASKVFATITPDNQILLNWILLRKPVKISSVPETPSILLSVLEVLVLTLLLLRKDRSTRKS
jgi:hypothetical protein